MGAAYRIVAARAIGGSLAANRPKVNSMPADHSDDPLLLARHRLFPAHGLPIHVNRPRHDGEVPLHRHDFLEIAVVCGGQALHRTVQGLDPVTRGDVIVLRPGHWHAYERCRDLQLANVNVGQEVLGGPLAWIRGDAALAPFLGLGRNEGPMRVHLDDPALERTLNALEGLRTSEDAGDLARAGHLLIALQGLADAVGAEAVATTAPHPLVVASIDRLRAAPGQDWTLPKLAALAGVTPSYLVRLFRRFTGHTPLAWLARERLQQVAVLLLTTDLTLPAIARQVGWSDPTHLVRRFKAYAGQTPGDYRRQLPVKPTPVLTDAWIQW
jgi:AraC family L-rhamnose operon transcriptional activator RhaR